MSIPDIYVAATGTSGTQTVVIRLYGKKDGDINELGQMSMQVTLPPNCIAGALIGLAGGTPFTVPTSFALANQIPQGGTIGTIWVNNVDSGWSDIDSLYYTVDGWQSQEGNSRLIAR